jgi:hypothetical protein
MSVRNKATGQSIQQTEEKAIAEMKATGFTEHRGYWFEQTHERGRPVVYVWNSLYIICRVADDMDDAKNWVSWVLDG